MKHDRASELRAIADGRLLLNVRNGVTVSRSMLAMIADELDAELAAHAETKRERDELRGHLHLANRSASDGMSRENEYLARTKAAIAQRDEALKALEKVDRILRIDEIAMSIRISDAQDVIEAARRVREGGKS